MMKDKYKTLIKACWIVLLCCFVVKLLGGNFFEIACYNETFIKICDVIQNNKILYYIVVFINFYIGAIFYYKAVLQEEKLEKFITVHIIIILIWIVKLLVSNLVILPLLIDLLFMILIPIILNKQKWKRAIIGFFLNLGFQLTSLITKNIGIKIIDDNILITLIFMIDYYIMMILYYLYSIKNKKGE